MDASNIRLVALDLDGTLTQHKTKLGEANKAVLDILAKKYKLLMIGAGSCARIFAQLDGYPIDIIGNYGMQYAEYDAADRALRIIRDDTAPVNKPEIERRAVILREKFGLNRYTGDSMEYHASGALTFPVLGTMADIKDKLTYDPSREKRRVMYPFVKDLFPDYKTFVGGSSSFDFAPMPFCKLYALDHYCTERGFLHHQAVYVGDDYGPGGNDQDLFESDFPFIAADDYKALKNYVKHLL